MQDKRIALVTGANQGVGLQVAKELVAKSLIVLVGSRNFERGEAAAKEIGPGAIAVQLEVTDRVSIADAAERIRKEFGRLDLLVQNAAISNTNDAGAIAGSYIANGRGLGFVRDPRGKFTSFDFPPPFLNIQVSSINNEGAITGTLSGPGLAGSVLRSPDGTITFIAPPGVCIGRQLPPSNINDNGVITGSCTSMTPPFSTVGWVRFP